MSAIYNVATLEERINWWTSSLGGCLVCGAPLQYPFEGEGRALTVKSDIETLLFKYGLANGMEAGHLIDRYVLNNILAVNDNHIRDLKLNVQSKWDKNDDVLLANMVEQALNFTIPVCRDCNMAMTKIQSNILTTFYGVLNPDWFNDGRIPFEHLKKIGKRMSNAKVLEAIFVFFTLEPFASKTEKFKSDLKRVADGKTTQHTEIADADDTGESLTTTTTHDSDHPPQNMSQEEVAALLPVKTQKWLGALVRKYFDNYGFFWGKVQSVKYLSKSKIFVYQVLYTDGDTEDLEEHELKMLHQDAMEHELPADIHDDIANMNLTATSSTEYSTTATGSRGRSEEKQLMERLHKFRSKIKSHSPVSTRKLKQPERSTLHNLKWNLKAKALVWSDHCILKTVSHLMQWGANKQGRHRVLAVFWSAHYLWLSYLTPDEQGFMEFKIWFTHVFRPYYMHEFDKNTWFQHDSLTIAQLTNVNTSMQNDQNQYIMSIPWLKWVREQLSVLSSDMTAISTYVFKNDPSQLRVADWVHKLNTKETIRIALDNIRERVGSVQSLYDFMKGPGTSMQGLKLYFEWYLFSMRGTKYVQDNVASFQTDVYRILTRNQKKM
eukprot:3937581-Rhodomonas_salina.3